MHGASFRENASRRKLPVLDTKQVDRPRSLFYGVTSANKATHWNSPLATVDPINMSEINVVSDNIRILIDFLAQDKSI